MSRTFFVESSLHNNMIAGTGLDIVEIERFSKALERNGKTFIKKVFTKGERKYSDSQHNPLQHYAARFAAKEAVLKAIKTGWTKGTSWQDVEIIRCRDGSVRVSMKNISEKIAKQKKIKQIHLTITHTKDYAAAFAVAEM